MAVECILISPGTKLIYKEWGINCPGDVPRGLLSIASFLNHRGIETEILAVDSLFPDEGNIPDDLEIYSRIKKSIENLLNKNAPLIIGISFIYTRQFGEVSAIAKICKKIAPEITLVVGGGHPTFLPARTLEEIPEADIIVMGEGEWVIADLITGMKKGKSLAETPGLTFREYPDRLVSTAGRPFGNTLELPVIDYSLLPEGYLREKEVFIVGSRGCNYNCTFCAEKAFFGGKMRRLRDENIFHEIRELTDIYECRQIAFEDSMFDLRTEFSTEFFAKLRRFNETISSNRLGYLLSRVDTINKQGLNNVYNAGIKAIIFGMESASERALKLMNKKITKEMIINACRLAKDSGFEPVCGNWIVGHPGDSVEEFQKTYDTVEYLFSKGWLDFIEFFKFVPFPGTPPFHQQEKYGVEIQSYDWSKFRMDRYDAELPISQLKNFSREEIHECWKRLWSLNLKYSFKRAIRLKQQIIHNKCHSPLS